MKSDTIQIEFSCPKCGESGLTPRMSPEKALAVARGDLQLRCPSCNGIIEITEPLAKIMLKAPLKKAADTISSVLRGTLKGLDRRAPDEDQDQPREEVTDTPNDLGHPVHSDENRASEHQRLTLL